MQPGRSETMKKFDRRSFLKTAAAIGASIAWVEPARASRVDWRERRDLYPQGVASGDPDAHSVILWTRRPFDQGTRHLLTVEVAEDEAFRRVIAHAQAPVSSAADWTARASKFSECLGASQGASCTTNGVVCHGATTCTCKNAIGAVYYGWSCQ